MEDFSKDYAQIKLTIASLTFQMNNLSTVLPDPQEEIKMEDFNKFAKEIDEIKNELRMLKTEVFQFTNNDWDAYYGNK